MIKQLLQNQESTYPGSTCSEHTPAAFISSSDDLNNIKNKRAETNRLKPAAAILLNICHVVHRIMGLYIKNYDLHRITTHLSIKLPTRVSAY